jgi:hypothetical protein
VAGSRRRTGFAKSAHGIQAITERTMKTLSDTLVRFMPPLWLMLAIAAVLGVALLATFIDLLQQNVRRGEEMRQWQRVGVVRHPIGTVATAAPQAQPSQLATSFSQPLQR